MKLTPLVQEVLPKVATNDGPPEHKVHGQIYAIVNTETEVIMLGNPIDDPEDEPDVWIHNCDQMGCRWEHVLWRFNKPHNQLYGESTEAWK